MARRHSNSDRIGKCTPPIRTQWDEVGAAISNLRSHLESLEAWFPDICVDFSITLTRKGRKD